MFSELLYAKKNNNFQFRHLCGKELLAHMLLLEFLVLSQTAGIGTFFLISAGLLVLSSEIFLGKHA